MQKPCRWQMLFIIAVGLSMDAFAVSVCKGLSVQKAELRNALCVGAYFGGFQALMPLIGYLLGTQFQSLITSVDHWIAFVLLALIGGNMIRESFGEEEQLDACFTSKAMLPLAVATSIDAGHGCDLCIFAGEHCVRRSLYRGNNLRIVGDGVEDRKYFRRTVQNAGGALWRYGTGADGGQDPAGAPGRAGIIHRLF